MSGAAGPTPEELLARLRNVREVGPDRWRASCPCAGHVNADASPSLSVAAGRHGAALTTCWSQHHSFAEVLSAAGCDAGPRRHTPRPPVNLLRAALVDVLAHERRRRARLNAAFAGYRIADAVRLARRLGDVAQRRATALGPEHPHAWGLVAYGIRLEVAALNADAALDAADVRP